MAGEIRVEVQSAPTLNFAMEQSGVPIVSGLRIENAGGESLEGADLTITIRPNLVEEASFRIPKIRAGETAYGPESRSGRISPKRRGFSFESRELG